MNHDHLRDRLMGALIGVLVGDALGVPVEFTGRAERDQDPVMGMRGLGTWNQPAGTWSDDSSMTLATADVLARAGWDLPAMLQGFLGWLERNEWTSHGAVFDIGNATRNALMRFRSGGDHTTCGQAHERDNGNGSLMRCMPVSLWLVGASVEQVIEQAGAASALTHAHVRSRLCCAWHALWCDAVLGGRDARAAASQADKHLRPLITQDRERQALGRLLDGGVMDLPRTAIQGDGYVVSTLEACLWCLANHGDFRATVLAAVNLGDDADTTGAVAGGMAGLVYRLSGLPGEWTGALARHADVMALAARFADACIARWKD